MSNSRDLVIFIVYVKMLAKLRGEIKNERNNSKTTN